MEWSGVGWLWTVTLAGLVLAALAGVQDGRRRRTRTRYAVAYTGTGTSGKATIRQGGEGGIRSRRRGTP